MDQPKTRRETKKDPKEKARKGEYTQKHVRMAFKLSHHRTKNGNVRSMST
jgi:hypothetical protein